MALLWTKGRGKLGVFAPLLGSWVAKADSPMGPVQCTRTLEPALNDSYLQLSVQWAFGQGEAAKVYRELAMIGPVDKTVRFWSFTSDGKRSEGELTDVSDLHAEAVGFEAQMPAGTARMAYWPLEDGGFTWVVESKTKKGWNRMVEHHYHRA